MSGINPISFHGHGSESTGSISHSSGYSALPTENSVNFKAQNDSFEKNKGTSTIGIIGGIALLGAGAVVGLGYAHKTNILSKMKDGKFKEILQKAEPAAKKCHEWCATIKAKGTEVWNKIQNTFKSKGD